ncbi:MAG TPA: class I adenylate-forming enzyme family protein [Burkholderiales bacterium]|nr:class I adenylate-forming enzyme family protein [Burkholderiales bacterium]
MSYRRIFDAASVPEAILATARDPAIRARPALWAEGRTLDYSALADAVTRVSGLLLERGLRRGERVALIARRSVDAVAGAFGIMAAGGAVCVVDERLPPAELGVRLRSAEIGWLLADATHRELAGAAAELKRIELEDAARASPRAREDIGHGDDALLVMTSGSTGTPKAVLLTHGNLLSNAYGVAERTGVTPEDRLLHLLPLHHTNGTNNLLVVPFCRGASVVMLARFHAETLFQEIAAHRPTYVTGVATHYSRLLAHEPPPGALASLRFLRSGAAPLNAQLHLEIERHLGLPLIHSYGLSEDTCTATMNPPAARRIGTVGTALAGQRVAVLAPGSEQPVAVGSEGEICIAGPSLMKGYVPPAGHADGPSIRDGWLRTGDLGWLDGDGYLTVSGRLKEIILRGGENLSPGRIEEAILRNPAVRACCVVGAPDADLGEVPVAFVVAGDGASVRPEAIQDQVRSELPRACVPARVVVLGALPEIGIGKIDRAALKRLAAAA